MINSSEEFAGPLLCDKNKWITRQVCATAVKALKHINFRYIIYMLTSTSIFSPNKHEKNVKGALVATQDLPYK
jgi:hypothetical protein